MSDVITSKLKIDGVVLLTLTRHQDDRGWFQEVRRDDVLCELGLCSTWVQTNMSRSCRNVIRGLHYQVIEPQAKLVMVIEGGVYDVVVDLRRGSPTQGKWDAVQLVADFPQALYVPTGIAHGFAVMSDHATVMYECSARRHPGGERGLRWDCPKLQATWPVSAERAILSERDKHWPGLDELNESWDSLPSHPTFKAPLFYEA